MCKTSLQIVIAAMKLKDACSLEGKLFKSYSKVIQKLFKSRDITLPTKVRLVKAMVFPVVMYGCESWTVKKAECRRIYVFELGFWRRLFRVPWTTRRSNQSILMESIPEYSLEGCWSLNSNTLATWCEELTFEKILMLSKIEDRRRRVWQRMRWLDGITDRWTWLWVSSGSWWWTGKPGMLQSMGSQRVGHNSAATELNWNIENKY